MRVFLQKDIEAGSEYWHVQIQQEKGVKPLERDYPRFCLVYDWIAAHADALAHVREDDSPVFSLSKQEINDYRQY